MKKAELWANSEWRAAHWGNRRGRPWAADDETCARFLRHCGLTDTDIGQILRRTARSVEAKIGYQREREYAVIYEAARSTAAHSLGHLADSYLTTATAGHA